MDSDSELVLAARAGDKAAFGELITRYEPMVRRLAGRIVGDSELAYDLAQEALLQAYLSLDSLRQERSFRSWLYGLTLNVCRMFIRSQRSNVMSLEVLVGGLYHDDGPTPEEIVERMELRRAVMNAVEMLSPANRAAVLLCYYEDFSLRDSAAMLGISVTALKGRPHKARRQLQTSLQSIQSVERGATNMIPVKIVDVMDKPSMRGDEKMPFNQVILLDEASRRAIVIWVGSSEGAAIAFGMAGFDYGRPLMPVFVSRLLQATGATLEQVVISTLKDDIFYATARIRVGDTTQDIDARPSDALAVAVQMNTPIYVTEEVMTKVGKQLPAGATATGRGIKNIVGAVEAQIHRLSAEASDEVQKQRAEQLKLAYEQQNEAVLLEAFGGASA